MVNCWREVSAAFWWGMGTGLHAGQCNYPRVWSERRELFVIVLEAVTGRERVGFVIATQLCAILVFKRGGQLVEEAEDGGGVLIGEDGWVEELE